MGHNNVVSGHLKSTGVSRVDGLSTGPSDLGHHSTITRTQICIPCMDSYMYYVSLMGFTLFFLLKVFREHVTMFINLNLNN